MRVTVLGSGSWGTTVAMLVAGRHPTVLWARDAEHVAEMAAALEAGSKVKVSGPAAPDPAT